ncbi:hypothetical protein [Burkholderia sp. TSV86]|uniref:hypothetical protein n=1 Tax=Burkholderia sp. TSV86 TaxID=1385594 RepID=UPI0012E34ADF|nr:hypothetical protein [Burkholderia sp. TSV86]
MGAGAISCPPPFFDEEETGYAPQSGAHDAAKPPKNRLKPRVRYFGPESARFFMPIAWLYGVKAVRYRSSVFGSVDFGALNAESVEKCGLERESGSFRDPKAKRRWVIDKIPDASASFLEENENNLSGMLDTKLMYLHNRQFSTEGCPSG